MTIQCPACLQDNPDRTTICSTCGYEPLDSSSNSSTTTSSTYHLSSGVLLKQGQYQIEKVLGEGGFGITYKGQNRQNSSLVAIKELWPEKSARQGATVTWPSSITPKEKQLQINKFKLEASNQQKCLHPNIPKIYEWFEENHTVYIIMAFISGQTLYDILKAKGVLSENQVKHYFIQVAEALKVIHDNNFLHRDIKPDNILIDSQDRAILIDFGATKEFIAGQTREMSVTLTAGYAPYEQYSYRSKRYPATDFYALCASMYELLTGKPPIEAVDRVNALVQGGSSDPLIPPRKLNSNLSRLIKKVILTGMKINVAERFQTADELIDALKGKFVSPLHKQAQELVKQDKLKEAIKAYGKLITNEPGNGEAAVELALVQLHVNDSQAEIPAQKAIQIQPNDGRAYGVLGLVNCRKSQWAEAVKQLQQAANLSPQEAWIQANLAWALGKTGNWQQAEIAVAKAVQLDNNCTFALGIQAWIAINQKQWKSAIRAATPAIFKSKQTPSADSQTLQLWVYPLLIFALEKAVVTKQARDVERRIEEFITQNPDHAWGWSFKGWKKSRQGLWNEALLCFEQATRLAQVSNSVIINHAIALEHLNSIQEAIKVYQTHRQKFGDDAFVLFRLGTLLGKMEKWIQAGSYLEKAIQILPNYAEAYHNQGWVLLNTKNSDGEVENIPELLSAYRQAVKLYEQQHKLNLSQTITQAFQVFGVKL
ncbi:MAG: protein kinase [Xenococcaceae cyanobacterium MO_167.B27]|nr:protein kinase [Xenococcaceae cyanobacterium MO_167.B27]